MYIVWETLNVYCLGNLKCILSRELEYTLSRRNLKCTLSIGNLEYILSREHEYTLSRRNLECILSRRNLECTLSRKP